MTTDAHPTKGSSQSEINARIVGVGDNLATTLRGLIDAIPEHPQTPKQLATALGLDKVLSHRVVTALRKKDPVAVVHLLPGPVPLRRLVAAAQGRGVPADVVTAAEGAIQGFDHLIRHDGGDRSGLDAIVSAWLPEARTRFEAVAKQSVYRGARQLKGVSADVTFMACFLHPSSKTPSRSDLVSVMGYLGLRRVRPGADLRVAVQSVGVNMEGGPLTIDGQTVRDLQGVILEDFCSDPPVELDVYEDDKNVLYGLRWGEAVGQTSARDIVFGELRRDAYRRYRSPNDTLRKAGIENAITVPSRQYIGDILLHEDVYPDWEPRVRTLETAELGVADPNDIRRELDVLDVVERVESVGRGIDSLRVAEIPNYVQLLQYVCTTLGWNPAKLRAYRTRIDYPIFGSQIQFTFDVPLEQAES